MVLNLKELEVPVKQMHWVCRAHPAWEVRLRYTVMLMNRSSSALIPCMHAFALNIKVY